MFDLFYNSKHFWNVCFLSLRNFVWMIMSNSTVSRRGIRDDFYIALFLRWWGKHMDINFGEDREMTESCLDQGGSGRKIIHWWTINHCKSGPRDQSVKGPPKGGYLPPTLAMSPHICHAPLCHLAIARCRGQCGSMQAQRLRRWTCIEPHCLIFQGDSSLLFAVGGRYHRGKCYSSSYTRWQSRPSWIIWPAGDNAHVSSRLSAEQMWEKTSNKQIKSDQGAGLRLVDLTC